MATSSPPRVLLVDDRPGNLVVLEAVLDPLGCELVAAASGEDALRALETGPFAVVLLDVYMPGMDGIATARAIRALEAGRSTPIVLVTAADEMRERIQEAYELGVADFLTKPFDATMLRAKVRVFAELFARGERIRAEVLERARLERERDRLRILEWDNERRLARERAARDRAEAENHAKDEFLALVSHELRTPLTAVLGWTRMLRAALGATEHDRALQIIERNAHAQAKLIDDLLDASRSITGKLKLEVDDVDLHAIVRGAIDSTRLAVQEKGLSLGLFVESTSTVVHGDAQRLQQVVSNLLGNAIKFTPAGGSVRVRLSECNGSLELSVEDTGRGIDPDSLPRVFDRFWQADAGSPRRSGGLGLGLAIVKHIVEEHGASIAVDSRGAGRGTTFTVSFPARRTGALESS